MANYLVTVDNESTEDRVQMFCVQAWSLDHAEEKAEHMMEDDGESSYIVTVERIYYSY